MIILTPFLIVVFYAIWLHSTLKKVNKMFLENLDKSKIVAFEAARLKVKVLNLNSIMNKKPVFRFRDNVIDYHRKITRWLVKLSDELTRGEVL